MEFKYNHRSGVLSPADLATVSSFYTHAGLKQLFGGEITYIGYPGETDSGSSFISYLVLAVPVGRLEQGRRLEFVSFMLSSRPREAC